MPDISPWVTVEQFNLHPGPDWMPPEHRDRIAAYNTYEDIYFANPGALKLQRGEFPPVILPDSMSIVDVTHHYLLAGLTIGVEGEQPDGVADGGGNLAQLVQDFIDREAFYSTFAIAQHSGVLRGDWVLHLTADTTRPAGRRLSLTSVHPAAYIPVRDPENLNKVERVHLVDRLLGADGKTEFIHRLSYGYAPDPAGGPTRRVWRQEALFDPTRPWWTENPVRILRPFELLPAPIDTIPVFHFRNRPWQGEEFGSSELRGVEALLAAIDQTVTDGSAALALDGLGVWVTTFAPPKDPDTGQEIGWNLGPGSVFQGPTADGFRRVNGVGAVSPVIEHVRLLREALFEGTGTVPEARGSVQVSSDLSGVALAIRFSPLLAKLADRETEGLARLRQLWFNWQSWHSVFEQRDVRGPRLAISLGEKLPVNKVEQLGMILQSMDAKIIDRTFARSLIGRLMGWDIPADMETRVLAEARALTAVLDFGGNSGDGNEPANVGGGGQGGSD